MWENQNETKWKKKKKHFKSILKIRSITDKDVEKKIIKERRKDKGRKRRRRLRKKTKTTEAQMKIK